MLEWRLRQDVAAVTRHGGGGGTRQSGPQQLCLGPPEGHGDPVQLGKRGGGLMRRVMFTCRTGPEQERGDFTTESFFLFSDHSGRACDWAVTNSDILLIIP